LIAAGWVIVAHQPHPNWFRNHVLSWSSDISILGLVRDLAEYVSVLAFGVGLVFGYSFDTTGPSTHGAFGRRRRAAGVPAGGAAPRTDDDAAAPTAREEAATREDSGRTRLGRRRNREPAQRQ
jgi:hypothetical protein